MKGLTMVYDSRVEGFYVGVRITKANLASVRRVIDTVEEMLDMTPPTELFGWRPIPLESIGVPL